MRRLSHIATKTSRRVSQTIREKLKRADITEDAVWDATYLDFLEVEDSFHELGAQLNSIVQVTAAFTENTHLAAAQINSFITKSPADSQQIASTQSFKKSLETLDLDIRRHVSKVYIEKVMDPLRQLCAERIPALKREAKKRNGLRKDLDAYRFKLQRLENAKTPNQEKIMAMRDKLEEVKKTFSECDAHAKREMRNVKWV